MVSFLQLAWLYWLAPTGTDKNIDKTELLDNVALIYITLSYMKYMKESSIPENNATMNQIQKDILLNIKNTRRTTGVRGYKFKLFKSIF